MSLPLGAGFCVAWTVEHHGRTVQCLSSGKKVVTSTSCLLEPFVQDPSHHSVRKRRPPTWGGPNNQRQLASSVMHHLEVGPVVLCQLMPRGAGPRFPAELCSAK